MVRILPDAPYIENLDHMDHHVRVMPICLGAYLLLVTVKLLMRLDLIARLYR